MDRRNHAAARVSGAKDVTPSVEVVEDFLVGLCFGACRDLRPNRGVPITRHTYGLDLCCLGPFLDAPDHKVRFRFTPDPFGNFGFCDVLVGGAEVNGTSSGCGGQSEATTRSERTGGRELTCRKLRGGAETQRCKEFVDTSKKASGGRKGMRKGLSNPTASRTVRQT